MKWTPIKESDAIDDELRKQITDLLNSDEWEYVCSEEHDYDQVEFVYNGLMWIAVMIDRDPIEDFYTILSGKYLYAFNDFQGMILVARRIYSVKESIETAVQTVT